MITVGMNYHVLAGKQKDFEDKFQAVIQALAAAPGHTAFNTLEGCGRRRVVFDYERMVRGAGLSRFHSQPSVQGRHELGQRADSFRSPAAQGV